MPERTDRELLELAARASGIGPVIGFAVEAGELMIGPRCRIRYWNPLADYGAALRLAVKLNMTLTVMKAFCGAKPNYGGNGIDLPTLGEDKGAVLCRAIVMVAAEIGANMQS